MYKRQILGRTRVEYYQDNKEKFAEWYQENKKKANEYHAKYYQENKEQISEYHAEWYKRNREKYAKWYQENKEKVQCGCGSTIQSKRNLPKHLKTKKHQSYLESLIEV